MIYQTKPLPSRWQKDVYSPNNGTEGAFFYLKMRQKSPCSLIFWTFLCLIFSPPLYADVNYWGESGLIRVPNARLLPENDFCLTYSQAFPYRAVVVTFGLFPFAEVYGGFTERRDYPMITSGPEWEGYGNLKDKSVGLKLLLFTEHKCLPSLSYGIKDPYGTQLFFSEYLTASKEIGPFDFTIGYGTKLLSEITLPDKTIQDLKGLFGGLEWKVIPKLSLLAEYDPTENFSLQTGVKEHFNYGIKWKPFQWLTLDYTRQRDEEDGFRLSFNYPFGTSIKPQKPDYPFYGPVDHSFLITSLLETSISSRLSRIKDFLTKEGFDNAKVTVSSDLKQLQIEYENYEYLSQVKALGRVLRVAVIQSPEEVERIHVIIKGNDIPMVEVSLDPKDYTRFLNGKISSIEMLARTHISSATPYFGGAFAEETGEISVGKNKIPPYYFGFSPLEVEHYINDMSGFYKFRVGPTVTLGKDFGNGLSTETYFRFPLYSDISTQTPPISDEPVRSDFVEYLEHTDPVMDELIVNKFWKIGDDSYGRLTGGYLEYMFAGLTAEYLTLYKGGRIGLGSEITWAQKRQPQSLFDLEDFTSVTAFLNGYLFVPELDTTLAVNAGRFLAGDYGAKFMLTKEVRGGYVYFWYTKTDTSDFTGPNSDYSDSGVGFALPLRVFKNKDRQGYYNFAFSPWTRDVGQQVSQIYSLYDFISEYTPSHIIHHWADLTE